MSEPTLADAKALIERTKACLVEGGCPKCERAEYWLPDPAPIFERPPPGSSAHAIRLTEKAIADGWSMLPHSPSFLKRCEACRTTKAFPWADKLDPEKVLEFMQAHKDAVFWLGSLEKTL